MANKSRGNAWRTASHPLRASVSVHTPVHQYTQNFPVVFCLFRKTVLVLVIKGLGTNNKIRWEKNKRTYLSYTIILMTMGLPTAAAARAKILIRKPFPPKCPAEFHFAHIPQKTYSRQIVCVPLLAHDTSNASNILREKIRGGLHNIYNWDFIMAMWIIRSAKSHVETCLSLFKIWKHQWAIWTGSLSAMSCHTLLTE